jgi:hypothetical protein
VPSRRRDPLSVTCVEPGQRAAGGRKLRMRNLVEGSALRTAREVPRRHCGCAVPELLSHPVLHSPAPDRMFSGYVDDEELHDVSRQSDPAERRRPSTASGAPHVFAPRGCTGALKKVAVLQRETAGPAGARAVRWAGGAREQRRECPTKPGRLKPGDGRRPASTDCTLDATMSHRASRGWRRWMPAPGFREREHRG